MLWYTMIVLTMPINNKCKGYENLNKFKMMIIGLKEYKSREE